MSNNVRYRVVETKTNKVFAGFYTENDAETFKAKMEEKDFAYGQWEEGYYSIVKVTV